MKRVVILLALMLTTMAGLIAKPMYIEPAGSGSKYYLTQAKAEVLYIDKDITLGEYLTLANESEFLQQWTYYNLPITIKAVYVCPDDTTPDLQDYMDLLNEDENGTVVELYEDAFFFYKKLSKTQFIKYGIFFNE